jgi:hypothetical protein
MFDDSKSEVSEYVLSPYWLSTLGEYSTVSSFGFLAKRS